MVCSRRIPSIAERIMDTIMNKFNWIETGNHNKKANVTNSQIEFHNRTKKNIDTDNMNEVNIT